MGCINLSVSLIKTIYKKINIKILFYSIHRSAGNKTIVNANLCYIFRMLTGAWLSFYRYNIAIYLFI